MIQLFAKRGAREREREEEELEDLISTWVISGQGVFTKYCGVLFC